MKKSILAIAIALTSTSAFANDVNYGWTEAEYEAGHVAESSTREQTTYEDGAHRTKHVLSNGKVIETLYKDGKGKVGEFIIDYVTESELEKKLSQLDPSYGDVGGNVGHIGNHGSDVDVDMGNVAGNVGNICHQATNCSVEIESAVIDFDKLTDEQKASIAGADGKDGKDGRDGVDGTNGRDGVDGKDGIDGKDGQDGQDGKDGITTVVNKYDQEQVDADFVSEEELDNELGKVDHRIDSINETINHVEAGMQGQVNLVNEASEQRDVQLAQQMAEEKRLRDAQRQLQDKIDNAQNDRITANEDDIAALYAEGAARQEQITSNTGRITKLEDRVDSLESAIAMQAAMANLTDDNLSAAVGYYEGNEALAIGTTFRPSTNTTIKASLSTDFDTVTVGAGIGYSF